MACARALKIAVRGASLVNSGALVLPLGAGFGYACGAIAVKRALGAGVSANWVNFLCNVVMAAFFQVFWIFPGGVMHHSLLLAPIGCGLLFFLGQIFTFRAIASGDVSVATPLLGTKVLLVALFSLFVIGQKLPAAWWIASALASLGIALISFSPGGVHRNLVATVAWSLGAAALFALTDVLVQRSVLLIGYNRFAPVMFGMTGMLSFLYLPFLFKKKHCGEDLSGKLGFPPGGFFWLMTGTLLLSLQSLGIYSAIGLYGSATVSNILYGSRCLWSVVLVWIFGTLAGAPSSQENHAAVMGWRFAGALLLFVAMALVLH